MGYGGLGFRLYWVIQDYVVVEKRYRVYNLVFVRVCCRGKMGFTANLCLGQSIA